MGVRNYRDVARVYFDFDNTLADFLRAARERNMSPAQFKLVAGAYRSLPLMPGAAEAVARVIALDLDPFGLTKCPAANPYSATEKLLWTADNLPELNDRVIISSDKGAVGTERDFLVEDMPDWANARAFRGTVIHFTGDWEAVFQVIEPELRRRALAMAR